MGKRSLLPDTIKWYRTSMEYGFLITSTNIGWKALPLSDHTIWELEPITGIDNSLSSYPSYSNS